MTPTPLFDAWFAGITFVAVFAFALSFIAALLLTPRTTPDDRH